MKKLNKKVPMKKKYTDLNLCSEVCNGIFNVLLIFAQNKKIGNILKIILALSFQKNIFFFFFIYLCCLI